MSAGKQRNTKITFGAEQLKELKAEEITELLLAVQIGDHQDWSAGAYFYKAFKITLPVTAEEPTE